MTNLSATALINGLTMLRAYNSDIAVTCSDQDDSGYVVFVCGVSLNDLHADDYQRMLSEKWEWNDSEKRWSLCA